MKDYRNTSKYDRQAASTSRSNQTLTKLPQIANVLLVKVVLLGLWHIQQPLQTDLSWPALLTYPFRPGTAKNNTKHLQLAFTSVRRKAEHTKCVFALRSRVIT